MNRTLFWRLAWKEYRMLRGFWIALALATVGLQLLAVVTMTLTDEPMKDLAASLFGFGLGMTAFYALGCGAMLFAVEREEETYEFLRTLPVSGGQAMLAKFAVAAASIVALWAFVVVESPLVAGMQWPEWWQQLFVWATFGLAAVEALVWGMFFSLVLRRPISAVFAAAATGMVSVGLIFWGTLENRPLAFTGIEDIAEVSLYRFLVILAVTTVDIWLARHWFDEALFVPSDALRDRLARRRARHPSATSLNAGVARPEERRAWRHWIQSQRTPITRLLWQQWRQSRVTMVVMTGIGAALVAWLVYYVPIRKEVAPFAAGAAAYATIVFTALAGANAFQADQSKQSFRFLAERGVRPATIWLSRHLVWLAPIALWATATAFLGLNAIGTPDWDAIVQELMKDEHGLMKDEVSVVAQSQQAIKILAGMSSVVVALAYAAGQFCSMFLRRGVVAWFFSLVLTGVLCWWAGIMDSLGISWLWSVAPIPLMLLLATWLRTPHWLLERTDRRARWRAAMSVAMPTVVLAIAVIAFRVYQIPYAEVDLAVTEFDRSPTAEERTTAQMYLDAERMIKFPPHEENVSNEAWWALVLADNQEAIQLALEATARPTCSFNDRGEFVSGEQFGSAGPLNNLRSLLIKSAEVLQRDGQLDAAWQRYFAALTLSRRIRPDEIAANRLEGYVDERLPYWAARPGQTAERIKHAIDQLQGFYAALPPASEWIERDYVTATRLLDLGPEYQTNNRGTTPHELRMLRIGTALVPWEMARSRRMLNLVAATDIKAIERVQAAMERGEPYADSLASIIADSAKLRLGATTLFYNFAMPLPAGVADVVVAMENRRRATLILLALEAWKAEHGKLPKTLDELVGVYLDKLPLDPYSGKPYRYVTWNSAGGGDMGYSDGASYPQTAPGEKLLHFLWSEQPRNGPPAVDLTGAPVFGPAGEMGSSRPGTTAATAGTEWWRDGRWFLIP